MPRLSTDVVHGGELRPRPAGAISLPVFQSANFEYAGELHYDALTYIRLNNTPNHLALHGKLAVLEGTEAALVFASGMAAISTTLLSVLKSGDHLLAHDCLYGGTYGLLTEELRDFGIEHTLVDACDPSAWRTALRPNTRAFYGESLSNPLVQVPAHRETVAFCCEHGLVSLVDNTFASPLNFRPASIGYDLVLHSATKYLNGHSDIVAGAVCGSLDWIRRITHRLNHLGGSLDPHACALLHRGLKTLHLRMPKHNENAVRLAAFLRGHPAVSRVYYPTESDVLDAFGGVLSFETRGSAAEWIRALRLATEAPSLGGVETLVTRPSTTSHAGLSVEQRRAAGISEDLIRVAVGLEDAEDLIADFEQAFTTSREPGGAVARP